MPQDNVQKDWLDEMFEEVETMVTKVSKFKTHKLRKEFLGNLKQVIRTAVETHIGGKKPVSNRDYRQIITHPHDKESVGHSVMTPDKSALGDSLINVGPNANPSDLKKSVDTW